MERYAGALADPEERGVFWLALALTQHRAGRLESMVQAEAIQVIEMGADVERWRGDAKQLRQRATVLDRVRAELESPPPAPKRLPRVFRNSSDWPVGEVVAYALQSGRWTLLRVMGHHTDRGGTSPILEVLDWDAAELPEETAWRSIRPRREVPGARRHDVAGAGAPAHHLLVGAISARERPDGRLRRLGVVPGITPPPGPARAVVVAANWSWLDATLESQYGLT